MEFTEGAVGLADETVKVVFEFIDGEIPGAGVGNEGATERLFELCEAVPGMFGIFRGSNTPKIER